ADELAGGGGHRLLAHALSDRPEKDQPVDELGMLAGKISRSDRAPGVGDDRNAPMTGPRADELDHPLYFARRLRGPCRIRGEREFRLVHHGRTVRAAIAREIERPDV